MDFLSWDSYGDCGRIQCILIKISEKQHESFFAATKNRLRIFPPKERGKTKNLPRDWFQGKSTYMFGNSTICVAPGPEKFQPTSKLIY